MARPVVSEFVRSHNSFSGVDMKATFGNVTIGELQAFSYSITREKAPIYTMGSADPRAFARGKRGIAGTLVFIMFDRHALLSELRSLFFQSDIDDIRPEFRIEGNPQLASLGLTSASAVTPGSPVGGGIASSPAYAGGVQQETALDTTVYSDQAPAAPWYADQIPGFDITLSAANESGALAVMKVYGVELLNEGYGISVDDISSEQQFTWIGRQVFPWQWVKPQDMYINRPTA